MKKIIKWTILGLLVCISLVYSWAIFSIVRVFLPKGEFN